MKIYTYGQKEKPLFLLLPGTCCHYRTFEVVIPLLEKYFHVAAVSYDGFDETEPEAVFPDMLTETARIEEYINREWGGKIFGAYGCSLGGSFVGLLIQRKIIHIDHGFIGSSDLDQAGKFGAAIKAAMVAPVFYKMMNTGRLPDFLAKRIAGLEPDDRAYIYQFL